MNTKSWLWTSCALVCAVAFGPGNLLWSGLQAQENDGWTVLFDGKSLAGWHKNPLRIGHGTGGIWAVEDGTITGEQDPPGSGNGGILLTDHKYKDFEIELELKPDWGVCSGFFLRSTEKGQCYQIMVDYHDRGNVGHIYGEGVGGFNNRPYEIDGIYDENRKLIGLKAKANSEKLPNAYSCTPEDFVKTWKINDWNTLKARCVGNPPQITSWINGVKISEFNGTNYDGPRYNQQSVTGTLGAEGHIAVQVHGGKGWPNGAKCRWRNFKIKSL